MTMEGRTAAKIADMLDNMTLTPPDTFGLPAAMSMLCEQAGAFRLRSTRVDMAIHAFDTARYDFQLSTARNGYSPELWSRAIEAAGDLAGMLRELGGFGDLRCGAEMPPHGRCKIAVDGGSPCPYHTPAAEEARHG